MVALVVAKCKVITDIGRSLKVVEFNSTILSGLKNRGICCEWLHNSGKNKDLLSFLTVSELRFVSHLFKFIRL